ncbi:Protein Star [Amphibalanus amphitrite]|uniref:Protein Star n=1 Tax=Amphibalanus amphitrite TaxID=1232801 RepID=A0A6A4VJ78_AMPAM|nr:Protein Star [Amphibalanus amphitrite]
MSNINRDGWPPRATDPALVAEVASRIRPPSWLPYNLTEKARPNYGQAGQVQLILALTRNKTGGFFIETGAYDGEQMSNTLLLERSLGWRGLLIEPSRTLFPRLMTKHRRSWALHACCSQTGAPFQAIFRDQVDSGFSSVEDGLSAQKQSDHIIDMKKGSREELLKYPVDCYPLYTILLAMNRTTVDFFSLDVEGVEMGVLAYLPWHLLDIKIVLAESYMGGMWNPQADQMRWFMAQQGYMAFRVMHDWLFVKKDSEFAANAPEIVRNTREKMAAGGRLPGAIEDFYNGFNDLNVGVSQ